MKQKTEICRDNESGNKTYKTDNISFISFNSKTNNYYEEEIEGKKFIVGETEKNIGIIDVLNHYSVKEIDDLKFVNSILKLIQPISRNKEIKRYCEYIENDTLPNNNIFDIIEEKLNTKDIQAILEWYKKNGLPFIGENGFKNDNNSSLIHKKYENFGFKNDYETCMNYKICGFRIGIFIYGMYVIHKTADYAITLKNNNFELDNNKKMNNTILEDYIRRTTKAAQFHYELGEKNKSILYELKPIAQTPLSAALFMILLWTCSPYEYILKKCKHCNCYFITKDSRALYCKNPCNKFMASKQKSRFEESHNQKNIN